MKSWPRALVALTVLVVLGVGGYAGQVWWARRVAKDRYERATFLGLNRRYQQDLSRAAFDFSMREGGLREWLGLWRACPWYGQAAHSQGQHGVWMPRRAFPETLRLLTGQDLPNEPDAWEAWFKAHPNLVWDSKRKRLVESRP